MPSNMVQPLRNLCFGERVMLRYLFVVSKVELANRRELSNPARTGCATRFFRKRVLWSKINLHRDAFVEPYWNLGEHAPGTDPLK